MLLVTILVFAVFILPWMMIILTPIVLALVCAGFLGAWLCVGLSYLVVWIVLFFKRVIKYIVSLYVSRKAKVPNLIKKSDLYYSQEDEDYNKYNWPPTKWL